MTNYMINKPLFLSLKKYGVSLNVMDKNNIILSIGTYLFHDNQTLVEQIKGRNIINFYPIEDKHLCKISKTSIKYEVGSEVGVLALLLKELLKDKTLPNDVKDYLDNLDEGYLSAESNVGEEEICKIANELKHGFTILLGGDLYEHLQADLLCGIISMMSRYLDIKVTVIDNIISEEKPNTLLPLEIENIDSFDGSVVYFLPSNEQSDLLYGSAQFSIAAKVKDKMSVSIQTQKQVYKKVFFLDENMKGTISIVPTPKSNIGGYRYKKIRVMPNE